MSRRTCLTAAIGALALVVAVAAPANAQDADLGAEVYAYRCAFCHGADGAGAGPIGDTLWPQPRDFTGALFKINTTTNETLPTDEDLVRIIEDGLPGTAMPAWAGVLTPDEIDAVVAHLKTFAPRDWEDEFLQPEPVEVGGAPGVDDALIARGREVFAGEAAQCVKCHGEEGRGDGPSAEGMTDSWDQPLYPANLHKAWRYKGGASVEEIFTRLSTGISGSPMPSYLDALPDDEDRWALAAYVSSLARELSDDDVLVATRLEAGDVPTTVDDARWAEATELLLPLSGQVIFPPRWQTHSVDAIAVQAIYNSDDIAFRLSWDDRFEDTEDSDAPPPLPEGSDTYVANVIDYVVDHPAYTDRVQMQFPAELRPGARKPYFVLGTASDPVTLWRWEAASGEALELTASGATRLPEPQPAEGQEIAADARYEHGQYQVVFTRPRRAADGDLAFEEGAPIPFALQAWDGSRGETSWVDDDGMAHHLMSNSAWYFVLLKPETPATVYVWALVAVGLVAGGEWWLARFLRRRRREDPAHHVPGTREADEE